MSGSSQSQTRGLGHDLPGRFLTPDAQRIRQLVDEHDPLDAMRRAAEKEAQRKAALGATGLEASSNDTHALAS